MGTKVYETTKGLDKVAVYGRTLTDNSDVFDICIMDDQHPGRAEYRFSGAIDEAHAVQAADAIAAALTAARGL